MCVSQCILAIIGNIAHLVLQEQKAFLYMDTDTVIKAITSLSNFQIKSIQPNQLILLHTALNPNT